MGTHHLIITGTGRTGTTFLVQLLTALGLDTGFSDDAPIDDVAKAGLEINPLNNKVNHYVIKAPELCDWLPSWLERDRPIIDHAIVPMRNLFAAAESRRDVNRRSGAEPYEAVLGGAWDGGLDDQETVLCLKVYKLMATLAENQIPVTLLWFPQLAMDAEYLYRKLLTAIPQLQSLSLMDFRQVYWRVSRPELIHQFRSP